MPRLDDAGRAAPTRGPHGAADPLSPERGSYRFAEGCCARSPTTPVGRDRKARHLDGGGAPLVGVPRDGEEVVDVVARHRTWTPWPRCPTTRTATVSATRPSGPQPGSRARGTVWRASPGGGELRVGRSARRERRGRARAQRDTAVPGRRRAVWLPGTGRPLWSMPSGPVSSMSSSATPVAPLGPSPRGAERSSGAAAGHRGPPGADSSPGGAAGGSRRRHGGGSGRPCQGGDLRGRSEADES